LFLGELGRVVTVVVDTGVAFGGGHAVDTDDRQDDGAADSCAGSGPSEVPGDGREELRRVLLLEVRALGDVDNAVDPVERVV
jgi:hypothetical protein